MSGNPSAWGQRFLAMLPWRGYLVWPALLILVIAAVALYSRSFTRWEMQLVSTRIVEGYEPVLLDFLREQGRLPTETEGLKILRDGGYVGEKNLSDLWGRPLIYRLIDEYSATVTSLGADGLPGGSGVDEDISITVRGESVTTRPTTTRGAP